MNKMSTTEPTTVRPVQIEAGQTYTASNGEHITVIEDDRRGSKPLVIRYDDRTQLDADLNEVVATAVMSRYSFADMANFDGFTLIAEADADEPDEDDRMPGEFVGTPPRCPEHGRFMSRYFDGEGFPMAACSADDCHYHLGASELIDAGHFENSGSF